MNGNILSPPQIATACWLTKLPPEFIRVGISRGAPRGHPAGYRRYPPLHPGPWFRTVSEEDYVRRYNAEVLAPLDARRVIEDLRRISVGWPVALLCFERAGTSDDWCHRSLVAAWLARAIGQPVPELGYERWSQNQHPLLPPSLLVKADAQNHG